MSWDTVDANTRTLAETILTQRQLEILQHRANGHSWRTIAAALNLDEATVRGHHRRALQRIYRHQEEAT